MRFKSILTEIQAGTEDQIVINECKKLLVECDRFDSRRKTNEERAKYIIDIVFFRGFPATSTPLTEPTDIQPVCC